MEKIKEPKEERIKALWEWCGFVNRGRAYTGKEIWVAPEDVNNFDEAIQDVDSNGYSHMPHKDKYYSLPEVTLDNLFKYAIPKMQEGGFELRFYGGLAGSDFHVMFRTPASVLIGITQDKDPALALFWAIYEVMHHEN